MNGSVNGINRRGVAPVIATLLMVSITVIGGTIVFLFAQDFMSYAQLSGTPTVESIKIVGYDARDGNSLTAHDGANTSSGTGGVQDGIKLADERVAVYLWNNSVQKITIAEIRFAGDLYNFTSAFSTLDVYTGTAPDQSEYAILTDAAGGLLQTNTPEIQPGQEVTMVLDLDSSIKIGRDTQFKITTTNGAVFVYTVHIGQQLG